MRHFEAWYPQFGSKLNAIMLANCSELLQYYRMSDPPYSRRGCEAATVQTCLPNDAPEWMKANIAIGAGCLAEAVETCILENTPKWIKSNMGAGGVLLGLLPTILSLAGPGTAETGLLAQRRPFLASLIALGSPAVSPHRMFMSSNPAELLLSKKKSGISSLINIQNLGFMQKLGILAADNNASHCYHRARAWAPNRASYALLHSSSRYSYPPSKTEENAKTEIQLSGATSHTTSILLTRRPDSYLAAIVAWLTSTGTILYMIYRIITFSNIAFISTQDAPGVVARYLVSTLVCRIILNFEMSGMRAVVRGDEEGDGQGSAVVGARPVQMRKVQTAP
ncbi:hypothetical protein VTI74DRAFT_5313 [Chaetomium olivicolor]